MVAAKKGAEPTKTTEVSDVNLLTREALAAHFGCTKATITRWENDGMPVAKKAGRGKETLFDAATVTAWKAARDAAGADEFLSLEKQRARLASAQAEKVERENRVRVGELIDIEEMQEIGAAFVKALTAKIRALPRRLVQVGAVPREQEAAAHTLCRELLIEISGWRALKDLELAANAAKKKADA